jgi:hypothetical protein
MRALFSCHVVLQFEVELVALRLVEGKATRAQMSAERWSCVLLILNKIIGKLSGRSDWALLIFGYLCIINVVIPSLARLTEMRPAPGLVVALRIV